MDVIEISNSESRNEKTLAKPSFAAVAESDLQHLVDVVQLLKPEKRSESLDEMYIKQQLVIEKLDKLVDTRKAKDSQEQRISEVLREENNLLRAKLAALSARYRAERHQAHELSNTNHEELSLLRNKLSDAELRIRSLEKQLDENARRWARENTKLRLQMKEAEFGLNRCSPFPYRLTPLPTLGSRHDYEPNGVPPSLTTSMLEKSTKLR